MKSLNKKIMIAFLTLFLITAMTTAILSGVYAGYSVTSSATVTATVHNPHISLGVDGDNSGVIIPGGDIVLENAPAVHLDKDSSPCYIFITIDRSDNFDNYLYFSLADGWYKYPDAEGVFFRINEEKITSDEGETYQVFRDNTLQVYRHLTRMDIATLGEDKATISVSATAIMKDATVDTAAAAWAAINNQ